MNGVSAGNCLRRGFPATTVFALSSQRPLVARGEQTVAAETLLAGVKHPPRGGEPRPLAALVPEVLARYGLVQMQAEPGVDLVA